MSKGCRLAGKTAQQCRVLVAQEQGAEFGSQDPHSELHAFPHPSVSKHWKEWQWDDF